MIRSTSDAGVSLIKSFEGLRLNAYNDAVGIKTIGYGHVVKPNERLDTITEAQAIELLKADLQIAESAVMRLITAPLNDNQFAALVSFTFNLGSGSLQRSTLRMCLNRGAYASAGDEFGKWVFAGSQKLAGLVRRRNAERDLFQMADQAQATITSPNPIVVPPAPGQPLPQTPSQDTPLAPAIPTPHVVASPDNLHMDKTPVHQDTHIVSPVHPSSVVASANIQIRKGILARLFRWLFQRARV